MRPGLIVYKLYSKMEWKERFNVILLTFYLPLSTGYLQYFGDPKTWLDAHKQCETMGGHLANGNYSELSRHIPDSQASAWTGKYKVYIWLWLTGCFDSMPLAVPNISIASGGIPKCFSHCNEGQQDFGIQQGTCFCISNSTAMTRRQPASACDKRRVGKCKWESEEANVRPCGGAQRFSSYTIAKDRVSLPIKMKEKKMSRCGSIHYDGSRFTINGSDCNLTKKALCKGITENNFVLISDSNWNDAYDNCKKEFAVVISPNFNESLQKQFPRQTIDSWIGLVREDITYTPSDVFQEPDECLLITHSGNEQFESCENEIGYICDIPKVSQVYLVWIVAVPVFMAITVIGLVVIYARMRFLRRRSESTLDKMDDTGNHMHTKHNMAEDHYQIGVSSQDDACKSPGRNKYDHLNQSNFEKSVTDEYDHIGLNSENYNDHTSQQNPETDVSYDQVKLISSTDTDDYDHLSTQNQRTITMADYDLAHICSDTDQDTYDHISHNMHTTKQKDSDNYDAVDMNLKQND